MNYLFTDIRTNARYHGHIIYARYDWEGNFMRYIVNRKRHEIERIKQELGKHVGVTSWFEVYQWKGEWI